jgi:hypothetical protein
MATTTKLKAKYIFCFFAPEFWFKLYKYDLNEVEFFRMHFHTLSEARIAAALEVHKPAVFVL